MSSIYKLTANPQIYCEASSFEDALRQFNSRGLNVSRGDIFKPYNSRGESTTNPPQTPVKGHKPKG